MTAERSSWSKAAIRMAADIALEKGVSVRLERDGSITVSPFDVPIVSTTKPKPTREEEGEAAWAEWDAKRAQQDRGGGRKPRSDVVPAEAPAKPNMRKLRDENHEEWEKLFVKSPLGKRERKALAELGDHGIDDPMEVDLFTEFGHNTAHRLWLRGFIDVKPDADNRPMPDTVWLTEAGKTAFKALRKDPEGH